MEKDLDKVNWFVIIGGMGLIDNYIANMRMVSEKIRDLRIGSNKQYSISDVVSCAYSCFFFQDGSFLQFQRRMEDENQVSNMRTLFNVDKIPSDDQIRNVLDHIKYNEFSPLYFQTLKDLIQNKKIGIFHVLRPQNYLVVAFDGSQIHSSTKIKCNDCIIKEHHNGTTEYVHNVLHTSIVSPNTNLVIPLAPIFSEKDDTDKKQDCEQKAFKRWFDDNFDNLVEVIGHRRIIFIADDLHAHNPLVHLFENENVSYITNCKEKSHKSLYEFVNYNNLDTYTYTQAIPGFSEEKEHVCRWLNNIPLAEQKDTARVNWFSLTIKGATKTKVKIDDQTQNKPKSKSKPKFITIYTDKTFSFMTNIEINRYNVVELIKIGRSRWKIENNNFNVLKNSGYKISHNYGHGKLYLANTLAMLNILAFSHHMALEISDLTWQKCTITYKSRNNFFKILNVFLQINVYPNFTELFEILACKKTSKRKSKGP